MEVICAFFGIPVFPDTVSGGLSVYRYRQFGPIPLIIQGNITMTLPFSIFFFMFKFVVENGITTMIDDTFHRLSKLIVYFTFSGTQILHEFNIN